MQDKNLEETEERLRSVLGSMNHRFGSGKQGSITGDAAKFVEMLAIEAQYGEPLIKPLDKSAEMGEKNLSQWSMFYEAIAKAKKFAKLKDCITLAKKSKAAMAKDEQI